MATSRVPGRACPLLPAWPSGVTSAASSLSQCCAVGTALTPFLCSRTPPAHLPPLAGCPAPHPAPCFPRAAGCWVPGLPALPGEAGAGGRRRNRNGSWQGEG